MRNVVVHYHIFKNAGTSLDRSLLEAFGPAWRSFEGAHAHDVLTSAQLGAFLRSRPEIRAVSSHLARPPVPWNGCIPLVMLRHPLLRARSVYEFTRNDPSQPFHTVVKGHGFAGFAQWALQGEPGSVVVRNYQTIHLSQASFRADHILNATAQLADLAQAMDLISQWGCAGVVEFYEKSLHAFNAILEEKMADITLASRWENHSLIPTFTDVETQLELVRDELGTTIFDALMAVNQFDLELYEFARKRLLARPG